MFSASSLALAEKVQSHLSVGLQIEASEVSGFHLVNVFTEANDQFIKTGVATGFDIAKDVALLKALSEFVERRAMLHEKDPQLHKKYGSDGLAAFPTGAPDAVSKAKSNAFGEAVERKIWSQWWDDESVRFHVSDLESDERRRLAPVLEILNSWFEGSLRKILIPIADQPGLDLRIFLYKHKNRGYLSGGSIVSSSDKVDSDFRASGELLRHGLAFHRMSKLSDLKNLSFYEQRLFHYASGDANESLERRLAQTGSTIALAGELAHSEFISHPLERLFCVHRCLLENQPVFMGGRVDRFCL